MIASVCQSQTAKPHAAEGNLQYRWPHAVAMHLAFGSSSHQHPLHLMTALPHKSDSETAVRVLGCTAYHRLFLLASCGQCIAIKFRFMSRKELSLQGSCACCASTAAAARCRCTALLVNGVSAATLADTHRARPAEASHAKLCICRYPGTAKPGKKLRRKSPAIF